MTRPESVLADAEATQATRTITAAVLGGSGFTGGELLRLLLQHPGFEVVGATSARHAGSPLHRTHPNLRGATTLRFTPRDALPEADLVFTCLPHGESASVVQDLTASGVRVVDLSADLRLADPTAYARWYGAEHPAPDLLAQRVYGLPELHRQELPGARLISGVGCVATATNLALLPLARAGLLEDARIVVDAKIGSSAAGMEATDATHHAHRSRSLRLYAPTMHRHAAEVQQELGVTDLHMSVAATELVRGVLATCHVLLPDDAPEERELWRHYREATQGEPFLRVVKEPAGVHRTPDPKLVAGSNLADLGFFVERAGSGASPRARIVATAAIDNLVKGAAGSAVQSANLALGLVETMGLQTLPLAPV